MTNLWKTLYRKLFPRHWENELKRRTCGLVCDNYSLSGGKVAAQLRTYDCMDCCVWKERKLDVDSHIFKNAGISKDEYETEIKKLW